MNLPSAVAGGPGPTITANSRQFATLYGTGQGSSQYGPYASTGGGGGGAAGPHGAGPPFFDVPPVPRLATMTAPVEHREYVPAYGGGGGRAAAAADRYHRPANQLVVIQRLGDPDYSSLSGGVDDARPWDSNRPVYTWSLPTQDDLHVLTDVVPTVDGYVHREVIPVDAESMTTSRVTNFRGKMVRLAMHWRHISEVPADEILDGLPGLRTWSGDHWDPGNVAQIGIISAVMSNMGLTDLDDNLLQLKLISWLDITHNSLRELPPLIGQLRNLRRLACGNNQIGRIPDEIGELTNLTWIDFTHNQISEVSPRIGELSNLAGLGISDCRLQSFPVGITRLGKLVKLGIFNNLITSLPREIRDLTSLTKLDVSNNLLTTLPREIGCLYNLTWLNLSHNRLTSLPDELGNLVKLRELGLGANRLKRLPNMSRLSEIVMLPIYSNQLVLLEPWIESLVRLEKFDVSCNRLSSIPAEVFSIRGLQYLNIKRNQISRLDMSRLPRDEATGEPVSKLHYLDASENRLAVLPFELSRLRIEEFRMQENPLLVKEPPRLSGGSVFPGRGPRTSTLQTLCVNALLRRSATEIRAEAQRAAGHFDPRRRTSLKRRLGCDYGIYREQLEQSENPPPSGGQLQLPSIYHTGGQIPYPKLAETVRARLPRPCAAALAGLSECHRCHVAYVPHKRRPERGLASPFRPAVEAGERRAEDEDGGEDGASKGDEFEPMEVEAASGGAQAADEDEAYLHVDFLNFNRYHHLPFLRSFCSARCREAHIEQSSWGNLRPSDASFIAVPILTDEPAGQHYFRLTGAAGTAAMAAVRRRFQPQAPTPPPPPLEVPQGLNPRPPPRLQTS